MPYKVVGNDVYHYKNGKWSIKARHSSKAKAKAQMRLLQGIEHGWKTTEMKSNMHKQLMG